jgi:hypothetical protein
MQASRDMGCARVRRLSRRLLRRAWSMKVLSCRRSVAGPLALLSMLNAGSSNSFRSGITLSAYKSLSRKPRSPSDTLNTAA